MREKGRDGGKEKRKVRRNQQRKYRRDMIDERKGKRWWGGGNRDEGIRGRQYEEGELRYRDRER